LLGGGEHTRGIIMFRVIRISRIWFIPLFLISYSSYAFSGDLQSKSLLLASKSPSSNAANSGATNSDATNPGAANKGAANKPPDVKDLDQAVSLYALGLKYLNGKGVKKNNSKAKRLFEKAAKQGYPRAEYQLGVMFRDGIGVGRDKKAAIKWFRLAAAWGEIDAKTALDDLLGNHKTKNNKAAGKNNKAKYDDDPKKMYRRAIMYLSGNSNQKDFKNAFQLLKKSASLDHKESQYELSILYKNGNGTTKSAEKAKKWLDKAAANGHLKARAQLRELLSDEEKNHNYKTESGYFNFSADSVYVAAAKKGDLDAQFKLGLMYIEGDAINKNTSKGLKWLRSAAGNKHLNSQVKLGDLLYKGDQLDQNYVESAKWYHKAAEQGHSGAQYALAIMYKKGLGLDKNSRKAEKWYRKAAKQGHIKAQDKISRMQSW